MFAPVNSRDSMQTAKVHNLLNVVQRPHPYLSYLVLHSGKNPHVIHTHTHKMNPNPHIGEKNVENRIN